MQKRNLLLLKGGDVFFLPLFSLEQQTRIKKLNWKKKFHYHVKTFTGIDLFKQLSELKDWSWKDCVLVHPPDFVQEKTDDFIRKYTCSCSEENCIPLEESLYLYLDGNVNSLVLFEKTPSLRMESTLFDQEKAILA